MPSRRGNNKVSKINQSSSEPGLPAGLSNKAKRFFGWPTDPVVQSNTHAHNTSAGSVNDGVEGRFGKSGGKPAGTTDESDIHPSQRLVRALSAASTKRSCEAGTEEGDPSDSDYGEIAGEIDYQNALKDIQKRNVSNRSRGQPDHSQHSLSTFGDGATSGAGHSAC